MSEFLFHDILLLADVPNQVIILEDRLPLSTFYQHYAVVHSGSSVGAVTKLVGYQVVGYGSVRSFKKLVIWSVS